MRPRRSGRPASVLALALLAPGAVLTGCGATPSAEAGARAAAVAFHEALRSGDAAAACGRLAPRTREELESDGPCGSALEEAEVPDVGEPEDAAVYGAQALVTFAEDSVFLSVFDDGWRVVAAGCRPQENGPYDCRVKD